MRPHPRKAPRNESNSCWPSRSICRVRSSTVRPIRPHSTCSPNGTTRVTTFLGLNARSRRSSSAPFRSPIWRRRWVSTVWLTNYSLFNKPTKTDVVYSIFHRFRLSEESRRTGDRFLFEESGSAGQNVDRTEERERIGQRKPEEGADNVRSVNEMGWCWGENLLTRSVRWSD